ncbi:MAG: RNA methyltransferase [Chlamydiota bacterium]|nr:RNA methyltransferase [Chlamydiota bacterium]
MNNKIINSSQNPTVKHLVKLVNNKKYREACKSTVIESATMIRELSQHILKIFTTNIDLVPKNITCTDIYLISESVLKKISGTKSPSGIIAEAKLPQQSNLENIKRLIVLDGVQDPGNLGTLIRTAIAFGWEGIFLLEGCCDPWNDKALRSSKGASFKLPICSGNWDDLTILAKNNRLTLLAADIEGSPPENYSQLNENIALVLGSEGQGLSEKSKKNCNKITIPINNNMESLNVSIAGGILMYLLARTQ